MQMTDAQFSSSTYNSGLALMMNFDNVANLGETSSIIKDFSQYNNT